MSLSGNLGFVSLDEVLRLLTRSGQQGSVDVRGEKVRGRVFITRAGVGLATTFDDAGLRRLLVRSGLVEQDYLDRVEGGETTLSPLIEKTGGALTELLREMTVESIYQLGINGDSFEVYEETSSRYASPKPFELEALLNDSKQRLTDWAEVSSVVGDLHAAIHIVRDIGDREEVKIDRDSWMVLSEVGAGASVSQMADRLGTTEFWTARVASHLVRKELVELRPDADVAEFEDVESTYEEASHEDVAQEDAPVVESVEEATAEDWSFTQPAAEVDEADVDPDESWWQEPEAEEGSEGEQSSEDQDVAEHMPVADGQSAEERVEEPVSSGSEEFSQIPTLTAEATEAETAEVEEDTEAFLEKVFSELESPEEPAEEGYGLLRRRRMGAIRDLSGDS